LPRLVAICLRLSVLGGGVRVGPLHHLEHIRTGLVPLVHIATVIAVVRVSKGVGGCIVLIAIVVNLGAQVACKRQFVVGDLKLSSHERYPLERTDASNEAEHTKRNGE